MHEKNLYNSMTGCIANELNASLIRVNTIARKKRYKKKKRYVMEDKNKNRQKDVMQMAYLLCASHHPQYGSLALRQSEHLMYVEQLCTRTRYTYMRQTSLK